MERLFFLCIGGFATRSHYRIGYLCGCQKENNEKKPPNSSTCYLHLYQDIISLVIFYIKSCLFHQHPKITKCDPGPLKLKQELSRAERIMAVFALSIPALVLSGFVRHLA